MYEFAKNELNKIYDIIENKQKDHKEYKALYETYILALKNLKHYGSEVSFKSSEEKTNEQSLAQTSYDIVGHFIAYWSVKYMRQLLNQNTKTNSNSTSV